MKIIFLDMDGVVRPWDWPGRIDEFCSVRAQRVADLCESASAKLVISSDWRHFPRGRDAILLGPFGRYVVGWTGERLENRGAEIRVWLAAHPEVSRFVILDDLSVKEFPGLLQHFVRCGIVSGLTPERAADARRILTRKVKPGTLA